MYNIAAFTHIGSQRVINQDRILVQQQIYYDGQWYYPDQRECYCFIADGIGGGPSGEFAAEYVLQGINDLKTKLFVSDSSIVENELKKVNDELIKESLNNEKSKGSGTTLVGIILSNDYFHILNAGDSNAWILRKENLLKLSDDQTLNQLQENSPITSYFGGKEDNLKINFSKILREIQTDDIIFLSSDGLIKVMDVRQLKLILTNDNPLSERLDFLLKKALEKKPDDNLSCIAIEVK